MLLITRVFCQRRGIKEVGWPTQTAVALRFNYSTAKTIVRQYRAKAATCDAAALAAINAWYEDYGAPRLRSEYRLLEAGGASEADSAAALAPADPSACVLAQFQPVPRVEVLQQVLFH